MTAMSDRLADAGDVVAANPDPSDPADGSGLARLVGNGWIGWIDARSEADRVSDPGWQALAGELGTEGVRAGLVCLRSASSLRQAFTHGTAPVAIVAVGSAADAVGLLLEGIGDPPPVVRRQPGDGSDGSDGLAVAISSAVLGR